MTPFDFELPDGLRATLLASFKRLPPPAAAQANELADLTYHATTEAISAIDRTAARAPSMQSQMAIMSAAISTTIAMLQMIQESLVAVAVEHGATVVVDSVQVRSAGNE